MPDHRITSAFAVDRNPAEASDESGDARDRGSGEMEDRTVAIRQPADPMPAARPAAITTAGSTVALLTATLGLAAASWVVAVWQMSGMDMGAATELGSFGFFAALWVLMMAAMMLPGAAPAAVRHVHASGRVLALPLFHGSYLAVWALVGFAVYGVYRPHGSLAAAAVVIAAGGYELTPLKRHFRRRCRESACSGLEYGLRCVGSSIGLMLVLLALGVMSITWMSVIAVIVLAQKLLPARAAIDVPVALAIVGLGTWVALAPSSVPGLMPLM
jgi:predicted metal-binding membrane protein